MFKKDLKFLIGLLIGLDIILIVGVGVTAAQAIIQWINLSSVVLYVNMWTATITMSDNIVLFISFLCLSVFLLGLFVTDLIRNILFVKNFVKSSKNF